MSKSTTPTCIVKTLPIGSWHLLTLEVKIPQGLSMRDHAEFSFDRQFAGLSPRGIPLSIKGSAGGAVVGAISLLQEKPKGWRAIPHFANAGLPVLTPNPRLAFFGIHNAGWGERCTSLCIHPDDLAVLVEIPDKKSPPRLSDVVIHKFTPASVSLLAQHAQQLQVVLLGDTTYVRVATSLRLDRKDWAALNRHLYRGASSGTFLETASIVTGSRGPRGVPHINCEMCFKLPGHSMDEVKARWGIGETEPTCYDGTGLHFKTLHVVQGAKLGKLYLNAQLLEGRRLEVLDRRCLGLPLGERGVDYSFPLQQALDAGLVPTDGVLYVDPSIETIKIPREGLQIGKLKRPVRLRGGYREEPTLLCPQHLMSQFLVPARQAVRTHVIPRNIISFRVRSQNPAGPSESDSPGKYYVLTDLQNLASRDLKREREQRRDRHQRLVDRHGPALPEGHETLTDAQIELYFEIQDLARQGEIIKFEQHPLMPNAYRCHRMLAWVQEQAPQLIKTCPATQQAYLKKGHHVREWVNFVGSS